MITLMRKLELVEENAMHGCLPGVERLLAKAYSRCRLATGRSAIAHLIRVCRFRPGDVVVLPAYVAEGVIKPFLAAGMQVVFYHIDETLNPCLQHLEQLLAEVKRIKIVVIVHMFGYEAPVAKVVSLTRAQDVIVLEDCAHSLFSTYSSGCPHGSLGDFALYSLNKFLPVPDGAILVSRRADIDVTLDETKLASLPLVAQIAYLEHLRINGQLLRCRDASKARELLSTSGLAYERYYHYINDDLTMCKQSDIARRIECSLPLGSLIKARQLNTRLLTEKLHSRSVRLVHQSFKNGTVPMAVPALVGKGVDRDRFTSRMLDCGVHLATLVEKWDFLPAGRDLEFKHEREFIQNHVLISVSEYLSQEEMTHLATTLNAV